MAAYKLLSAGCVRLGRRTVGRGECISLCHVDDWQTVPSSVKQCQLAPATL